METTPTTARGDAELRALALEIDAARRGPALTKHRTLAGVFTIVVAVLLVMMASVGLLFMAYFARLDLGGYTGVPFVAAWVATALIAVGVGATGWGFMRGRRWSRIPLWVIAVLATPVVPAGTALGAYLIWVLLNTTESG